MKKTLLLTVAILTLSCCVRSDREPTYVRPAKDKLFGVVPYDAFKIKAYQDSPFQNMPSDPNDSYSRGYQAGCQTMASAVATGFWRIRGPKIEPDELTGDAWYLRGYEDASTACTMVFDWELH
jgi:hypothetical protein